MKDKLNKILSTKSDKSLYVSRYINFVLGCDDKNKEYSGYTEDHHICPKASDLFPEYMDMRIHQWNKVRLTAHQHIIAHVMLWKIFGGSQTTALHYMLNVQNMDTNYNARKVPVSIDIRYAAKLREETKIQRIGYATYKDENNKKYFLHESNPLISELNLMGNNMGHTHTDEAKERMSITKFPNKVVELFMLGNSVMVKLFSDEYDAYIAQGWTHSITKEDMEYIRKEQYIKVGDSMRGRVKYMTQEGDYVGSFYPDDPIIKDRNLKCYFTDAMLDAAKVNQVVASQALVGTQIYNDGISEARFYSAPADPKWVLGRIERSDEWKNKQSIAASDMYFWHNGTDTIKIPKDETPGAGWVRGMAPQKAIDLVSLVGSVVSSKTKSMSNPKLAEHLLDKLRNDNGEIVGARFKRTYLQKHYPDLVGEIYSRTDSVPEEFSLVQRLFLLSKDITAAPACVVCGGVCKPNVNDGWNKAKLSEVCSSECWNKLPSRTNCY